MSTKKWRDANKEILRASRRKWYAINKDKAKEAIKKRKKEIKEWFRNYKGKLKCSKCSENHIACLTFHHLRDKKTTVSEMVAGAYSKKSILKEIEKCIVVCENCHRKLHYEELASGRS